MVPGYVEAAEIGKQGACHLFRHSANQIGGNTYDGSGNQTTVNGNTLAYDEENRLMKVTDPPSLGGATEWYYYDGSGARDLTLGPNKASGFAARPAM